MTVLYVANTTKQHHVFAYRLPEEMSPRYETINAGSQVRISGDKISSESIEFILNQYRRYGIKEAREIAGKPGFAGLVYSVDKPVVLDTLLTQYEENDVAMNDKASERREQVAAAIASDVNRISQEQGTSPISRIEVETSTDSPGDLPGTVAEGFEIPREGVEPRRARNVAERRRDRN